MLFYSRMRDRHMVVSIFLFLAILFFSVNSYSQHRPANLDSYNFSRLLPRINWQNSPGPDSVIRYDFTITLRDGVILDCLKYIPYGVTAPAGGFPTVIMCHGYGDNKNTLAGFCHIGSIEVEEMGLVFLRNYLRRSTKVFTHVWMVVLIVFHRVSQNITGIRSLSASSK